jgi:hypothetical protein
MPNIGLVPESRYRPEAAPGAAGEAKPEITTDKGISGTPEGATDKRTPGVQLIEAVAAGLPQVVVQRAPAKVIHNIRRDGTDELLAGMLFRGEYLVLVLRPKADTIARFDADPTLLDKLGTALTNALNPAGVPVPETRGFLVGSVVRKLVEDDLQRWVDAPDSSLVGLERVLDKRAAEFRKQSVRADLEAYLGVDPGTVNWPLLLPGIREDFYAKGN